MAFNPNVTELMSPDDPIASRSRSVGAVVTLRDLTTGREYPLAGEREQWSIGGRAGTDIQLRDAFVSGLHCVVARLRPGGLLVVRDQQSRNGTFVNGVQVDRAELQPGAVLMIGRTSLVAVAARGRGAPTATALEALRGHDPAFRKAVEQAQRAARSDCSVLILGETGTGKDLVARVIHEGSPRAAGPYVAVNCGGIPRELVGSELFGHERGAFTGATVERDGYFQQAQGGTLFLDELGELPLEQQPHLLRALETRRIRRLGGTVERAVNVRIVAATHRVDGLGTAASPLRLDLFHRLATVIVVLPPLRARKGDLRELVGAMLAERDGEPRQISDAGWEALHAYDWPGNVRELAHAVARAATLGGPDLGPSDFFATMAPRWDGARRRFSVVPTTPRGYGATSLGAVHGMAGPMAADAGGDGADPSLPPYAWRSCGP